RPEGPADARDGRDPVRPVGGERDRADGGGGADLGDALPARDRRRLHGNRSRQGEAHHGERAPPSRPRKFEATHVAVIIGAPASRGADSGRPPRPVAHAARDPPDRRRSGSRGTWTGDRGLPPSRNEALMRRILAATALAAIIVTGSSVLANAASRTVTLVSV